MSVDFSDTNKIIDEIMDLLERTHWELKIPNHPTKFQKWLAKRFFKTEFKIITINKKEKQK